MKREEKIFLVAKMFLEYPNLTIMELSQLPELSGISKSSIQRYLNDPLIVNLFGEETAQKIKDTLKLNSIEGKRRGDFVSFQNNDCLKSESGRFIGSKPSINKENIAKKVKHILVFAQIFLEYPNASLQEIADIYNASCQDEEMVTRDYVYDCLSEHEKYNIFSSNISEIISSQLEQRRILGNKNGADAVNSKKGSR